MSSAMHSSAPISLNPKITPKSFLRLPAQKSSPGKWMSTNTKKHNKTTQRSLLAFSNLISTCQKHLTNFVSPPLPTFVDPDIVFTGNLMPVDELEPTSCLVVQGELPACLNGVYIQNGPNPQHICHRPLHLFEGDGMLHSLRLSKGEATYCSRYVKTNRYIMEKDAASPIFLSFFSGLHSLTDISRFILFIFRVLSGRIDFMRGSGTANTNLAVFSSKLLALQESDLPYAINVTKEGDIHTIGRCEFERNKFLENMTAHPKVDPDTKEVFAFQSSYFFPPYITFFGLDEEGAKKHQAPLLSIKKPTLMHDFAITKRFAIFLDTLLGIEPMRIILGRGMPVILEADKVARVGIIPKYARNDSEMKWFPVPGFNALHIINAFENGEDEIVVIAPMFLDIGKALQIPITEEINVQLEKLTINIRTGQVSRTTLSNRNLECGSINGLYVGKKHRYAYLGIVEKLPKMSGVVKIDLENECEVSTRFYGPGCFGSGEPLFIAKEEGEEEEEDGGGLDEDDGFLVNYVHNENTGESSFVVMDAKSPGLEVVATVKMPRRIPYGFHGIFVKEENI